MPPATPSNRLTWWPARVAALALLALAFAWFHQLANRYATDVDFNIYYYAAVVQHHGSYVNTSAALNLAHAHNQLATVGGAWGTPTLVAAIFEPLTFLGHNAAVVVWRVLGFACVLIGVRKAAGDRWPLYVSVIAVSPALGLAIHVGNASVLTFSAIAYAFGSLKAGQSTRAGVALGVAIALKLYPGFLVLAFICARDWRAVRACVVSAIVGTLLALPILGPHVFSLGIHQLTSLGHVQGSANLENASFPGLVYYLTDSETAKSITNVLTLVMSAVLIFSLQNRRPEALFSISVLLMLLAQSLGWDQYFTIALLPLIVVLESAVNTRFKAIAIVSYAAATSTVWINGSTPLLIEPAGFVLVGAVALGALAVNATQLATKAE